MVSTPYMDEAEYATRIGFLDEGRLSALGTREEILASYPRTLLVVRSADRVRVREKLSGRGFGLSRGRRRLALRHAAARARASGVGAELVVGIVRRRLSDLVAEDEVQPLPPTLEDVFVLKSRRVDDSGGRTAPPSPGEAA